ncbi:TRAP transporter substrate-binding protein DctP [Halomonas sp. Y3]|uniref:TRAP transporter substrate-binding protein n=1 Tax=Halomonas sp. Y3 TaxID=2956797 RepID=UPI00209FE70B|nr:TRAP transporter substrate-binding protein DctP [Halomonas sp. Y3]
MKTMIISKIVGVSLIALASTSYASTADASVNIRFADSFPLEHYLSKEGMAWWMNRVEELTEGEVTFTHYPAEQLASAGDILQRVRQGAVQAGYVGVGYATDRLPLSGLVMLPGLADDPVAGSEAFWHMVREGSLASEYERSNVVPVFAVILPPYQLVSRTSRPESMSDLSGMRIRSSGALNLSVEAIGGTPVSMAATEVYLGMQRGTLDATLFPGISATPYNVQEVTESMSSNGAFGTFAVTAVVRKDVYEALSSEHKEALDQASNETVIHLSTYMNNLEQETISSFSEIGIDVYEFDSQFLEELDESLSTVQQGWVKRMEGRGLDAQSALDEYKSLLGL